MLPDLFRGGPRKLVRRAGGLSLAAWLPAAAERRVCTACRGPTAGERGTDADDVAGLARVGLRISSSDIVSVGLRRADTQISHHARRGVRPSSRTEAESADTDMGDAAGLVPRRNSCMWTWPKRTNAARGRALHPARCGEGIGRSSGIRGNPRCCGRAPSLKELKKACMYSCSHKWSISRATI
jgi:hypothetical protein